MGHKDKREGLIRKGKEGKTEYFVLLRKKHLLKTKTKKKDSNTE